MTEERVTLVLGGARSGKSRHAQALAEAQGGAPVFVATAQALDDEMRARVAQHRADRDARWRTVEAPHALAETIVAEGQPGSVLLVDCLTLWASNLLLGQEDAALALDALDAALRDTAARVVLVTNEVGLGIVPDNALARRFRDLAGTINQRVAARADRVVFIAAGLPLVLK
ncbi:bifunctional adenosylcobinamide kinase/adenosylcobinamide-phosphate guanylyltransferase [Sphingomonas phyllosphaerae]|uniref:bifunctional adenosylcobinamide kinase/adenosylcobinamide-phosphate guanylyltransferase n=1 Tax=Sphingomonas phyllosphaerae TaxID=257003 RepID=UPI0024132B3A|nr:bifunctional adenosylcobinamide kinase/adenosylcobinamide-phosphate guanylyltransferase [Sphingomonas phyllosphaerae]